MASIRETFGLNDVMHIARIPSTLTTDMVPYKVASEELIGIEVEVENVHRVGNVSDVWHMTDDGSLRNQGREFITDPTPAKYGPALLANLLEGLGRDCSFTPRTSVHVHLNVQDLSSEQVGDILLLYTIFEKVLYRYVGRSRIRNPYCVPIAETALLARWVQKSVKSAWEKYAGFNILPLRDKGTIEFRHMHGTFDVQKLSGWLELITNLKTYVKNNNTKELRKRLYTLTAYDVPGLIREVFPQAHVLLKWDKPEDFEDGVMSMKYALTSASSYLKVRSLISFEAPYFKV